MLTRGWTLQWKHEWRAWVVMKYNTSMYEKFIEENKFRVEVSTTDHSINFALNLEKYKAVQILPV